MTTQDSASVVEIRRLIPEDSFLTVSRSPGSATRQYRVICELGHGHFGITYMAEELPEKSLVAVKVEAEDIGRVSATIFEKIQARLGACPYFPAFRFYGVLTALWLSTQRQVNGPTIQGSQALSISQADLQRLLLTLPIQQRFLPIEYQIKLLAQSGMLSASILRPETTRTRLACTVMDFVEGVPLQKKPFSLIMSTFYVWQAARGLSRLHENGIVHGDIKPENIMIDLGSKIKILDFTTAYLTGMSAAGQENRATSPFSPWSHFFPRESSSSNHVSPYSDIYGLGAVLYYLATHEEPEQHLSNEGVLECLYYRKLASISEPWQTLIRRVFAQNVNIIKGRSFVQLGPNTIRAKLGVDGQAFDGIAHITTAAELSSALGYLVRQFETNRRAEWERLSREEQVRQAEDSERRWSYSLRRLSADSDLDKALREECDLRRKTEDAFQTEWASEAEHRSEIEAELGYVASRSAEENWKIAERQRRARSKTELTAWQDGARKELEQRYCQIWDTQHEHEWQVEHEYQVALDRARSDLRDRESAHFIQVGNRQAELLREAERRALWRDELEKFHGRNRTESEKLAAERVRRQRAIEQLRTLRQKEGTRRAANTKDAGARRQVAEWERQWQSREDALLAELAPWEQIQRARLADLTQMEDELDARERERQASRTLADKVRESLAVAVTALSQGTRQSTSFFTHRVKAIGIVLVVLMSIAGLVYLAHRATETPSLAEAQKRFNQANRLYQAGETLARSGRTEEAQATYQKALREYDLARSVYRAYLEYFPALQDNLTMNAHWTLAECSLKSYQILQILNNETLTDPIACLVEAERHVAAYNEILPSRSAEDYLVKINFALAFEASDHKNYNETLRAIENTITHLRRLQTTLSAEDQTALTSLIAHVCQQNLPELQRGRCTSLQASLRAPP